MPLISLLLTLLCLLAKITYSRIVNNHSTISYISYRQQQYAVSLAPRIRIKETYRLRKKNVEIVTHHKSGTFAFRNIYRALCGTYGRCVRDPKILIAYDGVKFNRNFISGNIIHSIRHPIDMLLSGYLYHKSCQEPEFWNISTRPPIRYPNENFSVRGSYCQYLVKVDEITGLQVEFNRSIYADDGIGAMMLAMMFFRSVNVSVLEVCLEDFKVKMKEIETFLSPWNQENKNIFRIKDSILSHKTNHAKQFRLFPIAKRICDNFLGQIPLYNNFPCKIQSHNQERAAKISQLVKKSNDVI